MWRHWRRLLVPTWLLVGTTLSGCDVPTVPLCCSSDPGWPPPTPPPGVRTPGIQVDVRPGLVGSAGSLGSIREGSYTAPLVVAALPEGDPRAMTSMTFGAR